MPIPAVHLVVDEGLGNTAYLVDLGNGEALAVDPPRDLRALAAVADRQRLRVAHVAETHLHADFLTGALQLAATGARVIASRAGRREYEHRGLGDEEDADLGGLRLRAWSTPGHTDEHVAYLLLDGDHPLGVFTGGAMIVGSAARTDLVDPARTAELAWAQAASLRRIATLPDETAVWPTHGAGSFCVTSSTGSRTTTVGEQRAGNPLLLADSDDDVVRLLTEGLGSYPAYFRRLPAVNRRGPRVLDRPPVLRPLTAAEMQTLRAVVVDVRRAEEFAGGHIPGAVSIPLTKSFGTWLGWLVDPDRALLVVRGDEQDPAEVCWQALKVGHEHVAGELAGGQPAWAAAGRPTAGFDRVEPSDVDPHAHLVVDVRQQDEYVAGHIPGAVHVELGALPDRMADLPPGHLVTMCASGRRATTAASLLARAGRRDVAVLPRSAEQWAAATGKPLAVGTAVPA